MKINWIEHERKNHILAWVLLESMVAGEGIGRFGKFNSEEMDVVLTVNGIEIDFAHSMDLLENHLTTMQEKFLQEGENNAKTDLLNDLHDFLEERRKETNEFD